MTQLENYATTTNISLAEIEQSKLQPYNNNTMGVCKEAKTNRRTIFKHSFIHFPFSFIQTIT